LSALEEIIDGNKNLMHVLLSLLKAAKIPKIFIPL
jgi:hypothetical protein